MLIVLKFVDVITVFTLIILSCSSCATQESTADKAGPDSSVVTRNPIEKPGPMSGTMNAYYQLKDAFIKTDGAAADMAATQLRLSVDSLNTIKLQIDSSFTGSIAGTKKSMLASIDSLIKQPDIQQKRRQFQQLSDSLYSLVKAIPYSGQTIYQMHCPMAFKTGANWLNNTDVINNPYYGSAMLDCGEVVDSIQSNP